LKTNNSRLLKNSFSCFHSYLRTRIMNFTALELALQSRLAVFTIAALFVQKNPARSGGGSTKMCLRWHVFARVILKAALEWEFDWSYVFLSFLEECAFYACEDCHNTGGSFKSLVHPCSPDYFCFWWDRALHEFARMMDLL
jgi:hypothetical protein